MFSRTTRFFTRKLIGSRTPPTYQNRPRGSAHTNPPDCQHQRMHKASSARTSSAPPPHVIILIKRCAAEQEIPPREVAAPQSRHAHLPSKLLPFTLTHNTPVPFHRTLHSLPREGKENKKHSLSFCLPLETFEATSDDIQPATTLATVMASLRLAQNLRAEVRQAPSGKAFSPLQYQCLG